MRIILHHLLEQGDVAGREAAGHTVITLAVDDWLLERLLTFGASAENREDNGDGEPDDDAEVGGPPSRRSPSSLAARPTPAAHSPTSQPT